MPNPHFDVKLIRSSQGQSSVVAAAAYRSGEALHNELENTTHDYTHKRDVVHAEIMAPAGAPAWTTDRTTLWNEIEKYERSKRKDAQLARSIIAGLPRELNHEQNLALVRGFIRNTFIRKGMIADFAIHEGRASDGGTNPHVHILLTLREINPDGSFTNKNRNWNLVYNLNGWRDAWETHTNHHLALAGRSERVSLKSYEEQGINKHPTIHLDRETTKLEKRGIATARGNKNRRIKHENTLIAMLEPDSDDRNQKSEVRSMDLQVSDKQVTLGAFRKQENDLEKLAISSLEASKAVHDAALREHLATAGSQTVKEPVMQNVRRKEQARRNAEQARESEEKVAQEAQRRKERDRSEDRDR